MSDLDFSLIIACYKDAPHLFRNVQALVTFFSRTTLRYELIFVEDCSPDDTASEVKKCISWLENQKIPVKAIFHEKNTGRGRSVTDGIGISDGEVVGYIDIDLEHLMDGLLPMIQTIQNREADIVVGRRAIGNPMAKPIRVISSYVYRWLVHFFIPLPVADTECGLKVFHRHKILPVLDFVEDPHWFWDTEIVHRAWRMGLKVSERWIVFVEDRNKASTVRLWSDTWAYLRAIQAYRTRLGDQL